MNIPNYLLNEHFNDRYFDVLDAINEAKYIYCENNKLFDRISAAHTHGNQFSIGELGFGAARLFLSVLDYLVQKQVHGIELVYNSVELYPLSIDRITHILEPFYADLGYCIDPFLKSYAQLNLQKRGLQEMRISLPSMTIQVNIWFAEALEMVHALSLPCDVWFLDGHGPKKNPDIWRPELLLAIGNKTKLHGTVASFSVAGAVRRDLEKAGFTIERLAGMGGKKSVLKGTKTHDYTLP